MINGLLDWGLRDTATETGWSSFSNVETPNLCHSRLTPHGLESGEWHSVRFSSKDKRSRGCVSHVFTEFKISVFPIGHARIGCGPWLSFHRELDENDQIHLPRDELPQLTCGECLLDCSSYVPSQQQRIKRTRRQHLYRCRVGRNCECHIGPEIIEVRQRDPGGSRRRLRVVNLDLVRTDSNSGESVDKRLDEGAHSWQEIDVSRLLIGRTFLGVFSPYLKNNIIACEFICAYQ
jgi:hypothetical protein